NKKLMVEIMYDKQTCFQDAAEFWIYYAGQDSLTGGRKVKIDSLLNNQKNCTVSADSFTLSEPTAGGYRLRFALNNDDTIAANAAKIRVSSKYQTFFSCKGCGAAGSDVVVDSTSIHKNCPYKDKNFDLLACSKRTGGAKNWEGFMVDHRDCKIYRMVAMPHLSTYNKGQGRWWLAQNLNYTKNLIKNTAWDGFPISPAPTDPLGSYWCPNSRAFKYPNGVSNPELSGSEAVGGPDEACDTYGVLYPPENVMMRNGMAPTGDAFQGITAWSTAQGVCPKGWVIPARKDIGVMFNFVEGCDDDTKAQTQVPRTTSSSVIPPSVPCHHYHDGSAGSSHYTSSYREGAPQKLQSTLSGRRTQVRDSMFNTPTNPIWPWYGVGSKRLHGARPIDYYGFSLQPSGWRRNYISGSTKNPTFYGINRAYFLSSTANSDGKHECLFLDYTYRYLQQNTTVNNASYRDALPLRCVREHGLDT
ncbi:MAG: FISUMP domain-containing protein, partial [Bacteroidales bacterium]